MLKTSQIQIGFILFLCIKLSKKNMVKNAPPPVQLRSTSALYDQGKGFTCVFIRKLCYTFCCLETRNDQQYMLLPPDVSKSCKNNVFICSNQLSGLFALLYDYKAYFFSVFNHCISKLHTIRLKGNLICFHIFIWVNYFSMLD